LCKPGGEVVATVERLHEVSMPHPGWVEHDAEEVWWKDFTTVCAELLEEAEEPVAAVCVSGIGPCFLAADEEGRPLRPGILYGVDTRAAKEAEKLTERYGNEEIVERCGNPLASPPFRPKAATNKAFQLVSL